MRCIVLADPRPSTFSRYEDQSRSPEKAAPRPRNGHRDMPKGEKHNAITAQIRRMIIAGEFPAGSRIREQPLSEHLGVSRTPVRQALVSLATEGFVQLLPNRSAVVTEINADDVENIMDVIATLEARAAVLACEHATDREIKAVEQLQEKMRNQFKTDDFTGYFATNQLIHEAIVKSARNPVLLWTWQLVAARAQRAKSLSHRIEGRWEAAMAEHEAMIAALVARKGKQLANLLVKHHRIGVRLVRRMGKE